MDTQKLNTLNEEQIRNRLLTMRDKISVLEWDEKHDQINPYKKVQLKDLKEEYNFLEERLGAVLVN